MESAVVARDHTGHGAKRTVFDGVFWELFTGVIYGGMAAVVSGHYGSAATTGRRPLRVDGRYGSVRGVGDVAPYG